MVELENKDDNKQKEVVKQKSNEQELEDVEDEAENLADEHIEEDEDEEDLDLDEDEDDLDENDEEECEGGECKK